MGMKLNEALLLARQSGNPSLIKREGDSYTVEEFEDDVHMVYLGGDQLPVPVGAGSQKDITDLLTKMLYGTLPKVTGAKIKRRL